MIEAPNSLLEFWKFPAAIVPAIVKRCGWMAIGADVPANLGAGINPRPQFYKCGDGRHVFAALSAETPTPGWQPLCSTDAGEPLVWTDAACRAFLFAFDLEQAIIDLLTEQYRADDSRAAALQVLHKIYYRLRPLIPRSLQMRLKHAYSGVQASLEFPAWPVEPGVEWLRSLFAWCLVRASGMESLPHIAAWPEGRPFCVALTHDVETEIGVRNIPALVDIECRLGVRSSWNFVPERYTLDQQLLSGLQRNGFEVGVHGLNHDGRLFESHRIFSRRAVRINEYGRKWGASGFRSPACHRNYDWMQSKALDFDYDSTYPDSDPYQPMPGGCCSVFPWFLGGKVELPISLPQDHVVFDILGDEHASLWRRKVDYIERTGGMALAIVHPDYMLSESRLRQYEDFLLDLKSRTSAWFALPRDVARWWRTRTNAALISDRNGLHVAAGQDASQQVPALSIATLGAGSFPGELISYPTLTATH